MRTIWKGMISFGLVSIPISLYPAVKREELKFRLLRESDLSPVNYKRVAEADGQEVPWDQIVKGYEYEKGKFVVLKEEDFRRVDIEATQTVDIINFVPLKEVNPLLFYKPYYMEPDKGADKAYVLLRDTLAQSGKIAIAKVIIRNRQHLAAIKPQNGGLMLELMHFPEEILSPADFKTPAETGVSKAEMSMAGKLVETMSAPWQPELFKDDYKEKLERVIEDKVQHTEAHPSAPKRKRKSSKVVDLVSVLQESLKDVNSKSRGAAKTRKSAA